jgi:ankyrin repeat protein
MNTNFELQQAVLLRACDVGDLPAVNAALSAGADASTCAGFTTEEGISQYKAYGLLAGSDKTPMLLASLRGNLDVLQRLLSAGCDANAGNRKGLSPLFVAAHEGHTRIVTALLEAKAEPDKHIPHGRSAVTPLFIASEKGHLEIVSVLLSAKADVHKTNTFGETPLYIAAKNGHTNIVSLLLTAMSDVNQPKKCGMTPLYIAAENGHTNIVSLLLSAKADVHKIDMFGMTPLYIASRHGHTNIVSLFLTARSNVNEPDSDGRTPLYAAAANGRSEVVSLLLSANADVNKTHLQRLSGFTPLYVACRNGFASIVSLLLSANADMNMTTTDGPFGQPEETPLYAACLRGNAAVVSLLLEKRADVNKPNSHGETPLFACLHLQREDVIMIDIDDEPNQQQANNAANIIVALLLAADADIHQSSTRSGSSPLHIACKYNNIEAAILLLVAGADLDRLDNQGRTPLDVAGSEETRAAVRAYLLPRPDAVESLRSIAEATGLNPDLADIVVYHGLVRRPALHWGLANEYRTNKREGLYDVMEDEKETEEDEGDEFEFLSQNEYKEGLKRKRQRLNTNSQ